MAKILLIEDDKAIADITRYFLESQPDFSVVWAKDGADALRFIRQPFDLIIMDILLPDTNGIDLCQTLRNWQKCPLIFSSCLDDTDTVVKALEQGGDDFIAKPFDNKVLLARIQAHLRRAKQEKEQGKTDSVCGGASLDFQNSQLILNGRFIRLSKMEYRLMAFFLQNPGTYFTAEDIYHALWGRDSLGDIRTVQVHIHNLRRKIEPEPSNPVYIRSEWGKGYLFEGVPPMI